MPDQPQLPDGPGDRPETPLPEALEKLRGKESKGSFGAGRYAGIGLQFAFSILFFLWVGQWADRRFGTDPLFLYIGVFTGAGAAFYSMYRSLMADQRSEERGKQGQKGKDQGEGRG